MLELSRQLMVLQDGQVSCRLELLVIHGQQIGFGLLNVEQHLFAQLLSLFDPIKLLLVHLLKTESLFVFQSLLQVG